MSLRDGLVLALGVALSCAGCKRPLDLPPPVFEIALKVQSDPNRPLSGARVFHRNRELATTGPDGRARLTLPGRDGELTELSVKCPSNHRQPSPLPVSLHRFEGGKTAEYDVSCPPLVRRAVVGIRAENGPNLPVTFLGSVVARTDAHGAAHFSLDVKPGETFEVQLKTDAQPKLVPQNPSRAFVMPAHDDLLVFTQTFGAEKKKAAPRGGSSRGGGPKRM